MKRRDCAEKEIIPLSEVITRVNLELADLKAKIDQTVQPEPYR